MTKNFLIVLPPFVIPHTIDTSLPYRPFLRNPVPILHLYLTTLRSTLILDTFQRAHIEVPVRAGGSPC